MTRSPTSSSIGFGVGSPGSMKGNTGCAETGNAPALEGTFPLSFAQESLWLQEQLSSGSAYNLPEAWRLRGSLDVASLEAALQDLMVRHESLRTIFPKLDGKPAQTVLRKAGGPMKRVDLSNATDPESLLKKRLQEESQVRFDLERGPLMRSALFRMGAQDHVLLLNLHHIISDAWSQAVLIRDTAALYSARVCRAQTGLRPLPIQFADFAVWQRESVTGSELERHLQYWTEKLSGVSQPLSLPPDVAGELSAQRPGATTFYTIDREVEKRVVELGRRYKTTLFATLLAVFKVLLHRYTRSEDIVVGSPIAGRDRVETENLIGMFVNTHALRTDLSGDPTFAELLGRVRETALGALAHQDVSSGAVLDAVRPERVPNRHPLFEVVFGVQSEPAEDIRMHGLQVERMELDNGAAKFDWTLLVTRTSSGLCVRSEHDAGRFKAETIDRLFRHFERLLVAAAENPEVQISKLNILSPDEEQLVVKEWNTTDAAYERDLAVHELFEQQAKAAPDKVALTFGNESVEITYSQLNQSSSVTAAFLQAAGVGAGDRVALSFERSPDLIVAILGVLKCAAVYVPLDRAYPAERQALMCRQSGARVLLTDGKENGIALDPTVKVLQWQDRLTSGVEYRRVSVPAEHPAYVMFTSGSTGEPKGAVIPHRAIVRLVRNPNYVTISREDVFLQLAPSAFDASTFEIWGALLNGATLAVNPPGLFSLSELGREVEDRKVSILWLTAGLFNQMVDHQLERLRGVRQLLTGGEALSVPHVRKALAGLPRTAIINGYGPTENTTFSVCHRIPSNWAGAATVPIGKPISNSRAFVLDAAMRPCGIGLPGELYVAGDGLACGYIGGERPVWAQHLQAGAKFIEVSLLGRGAERMYRTGDLARWLPDGTLEFLGRMDAQVKIRGFRVEPGEIENVLCRHPEVSSALVHVFEEATGKQLAAYVVPARGSKVNSADLLSFLKVKLPSHMVPSSVMLLDQLPLTPNGKVDRRALPRPCGHEPLPGERVAPRNETERQVARVWAEVLGRNSFDVRQNFFDLGGHSLLATQVASRLSQVVGIDVPVGILFEHPTMESLAAALPGCGGAPGQRIPKLMDAGEARQLLGRLDELSEEEIERLLKEVDQAPN